jgi:hypothetical protein
MTLKELIKALRKSLAETEKEVDRVNRLKYIQEYAAANEEKDPHQRRVKLRELQRKIDPPDYDGML